jgi:hypothetical protein
MGKQITTSLIKKKRERERKTKNHWFTEPLNQINSLKVLNHLLGH